MSSWSARRLAPWLGVAAVLVLGVFVAWYLLLKYETGGPLATDLSYEDVIPLRADQTATWGIVIPQNQSLAAITIDAIEAMDASGLEILGVLVSYPDEDGAVGQALGYPPSIEAQPPDGAVMEPLPGSRSHLEILFGIRRSGDAGSIGGIKVRYQHDGHRYETVLPYSLRVGDNSAS